MTDLGRPCGSSLGAVVQNPHVLRPVSVPWILLSPPCAREMFHRHRQRKGPVRRMREAGRGSTARGRRGTRSSDVARPLLPIVRLACCKARGRCALPVINLDRGGRDKPGCPIRSRAPGGYRRSFDRTAGLSPRRCLDPLSLPHQAASFWTQGLPAAGCGR